MACPLFLPASPLTGFALEAMPLGDLYGGECAGDTGALIPSDTLRCCCNVGYARGRCERANQSDADAVRFLIKANRGGAVEVAWAIERNHHPMAVGTMNFTEATTPADPLERQAAAYVASYIRQSRV
jgi:hypothetical protein